MKKIAWLLFPVIFIGLFYALKSGSSESLNLAVQNMPAVKYFAQSVDTIKEPVEKYGAAVGLALWLLGIIFAAIFGLAFRIFGLKNIAFSLGLFIAFGLLAGLGAELIWLEERKTILSAAIPLYFGWPLFIAGVLTAVTGLVFGRIKSNEVGSAKISSLLKTLFLMLTISVMTSGCTLIGDLQYLGCGLSDNAHCYQEAAVSTGDEARCEKVTAPAGFTGTGSNPPRDKCLTMIAQNKGDGETCKKIKGGVGSYSAAECMQGVADQKLDKVKKSLEKTANGKNATPEELQAMQKNLEDTRKMFDVLTDIQRGNFEMQNAVIRNFR